MLESVFAGAEKVVLEPSFVGTVRVKAELVAKVAANARRNKYSFTIVSICSAKQVKLQCEKV